jgi:hypothetical protein
VFVGEREEETAERIRRQAKVEARGTRLGGEGGKKRWRGAGAKR